MRVISTVLPPCGGALGVWERMSTCSSDNCVRVCRRERERKRDIQIFNNCFVRPLAYKSLCFFSDEGVGRVVRFLLNWMLNQSVNDFVLYCIHLKSLLIYLSVYK